MSNALFLLATTATVATSSVTTSTVTSPPAVTDATPVATIPVAAAPVAATKPPPPDLTLRLGSWEARLLAQYWARFIGDSGRDLRSGPFLEYVGQRARLGAHLEHNSGVAARVLLQDVRTWGEEPDTLGNFSAAGFDVQEAFVQLPIPSAGRLRVGRQELVVGNARLIGNVIWTLRARSFDGLRFDTELGPVKATMFYAKVAERDPNPDGSVPANVATDRNLGVLDLVFPLMKDHRVTFGYFLDLTADGTQEQHTFGPTITGEVGAIDYGAEAFLQLGERGGDDPIRFLVAGRAGLTLDAPGSPRLFAFADVVSSDGTAAGTFDTLYATNHKFYGEMDLFLNLPVHTSGRGLINPGAGVQLVPHDRIRVLGTWHHFAAYDGGSGTSRRFGDEVDLKVVARLFPFVQLRALYGVLLPGAAFEGRFGAGADRVEHFVYTTLAADL